MMRGTYPIPCPMWATWGIIGLPLRLALPSLAHLPPELVAHFTGIRTLSASHGQNGHIMLYLAPAKLWFILSSPQANCPSSLRCRMIGPM